MQIWSGGSGAIANGSRGGTSLNGAAATWGRDVWTIVCLFVAASCCIDDCVKNRGAFEAAEFPFVFSPIAVMG